MTVRLIDRFRRDSRLDVALLATAVVLVELFVTFARVDAALWLYLVELLALVAASYATGVDRSVIAGLALLPSFRLVNLAMPVFAGPALYRHLAVYGIMLPSVYVVYRSVETDASDRTRKRQIGVVGVALVLGAVLVGIEHLLAPRAALISSRGLRQVFLLVIVTFGVLPIVEELLFRGVVQQTVRSALGRHSGIALTSVVFGTMYAAPQSGRSLAFGIALGTLLGYLYDETRSLLSVWLVRGTLNVLLYGVLPVVVTVA